MASGIEMMEGSVSTESVEFEEGDEDEDVGEGSDVEWR